MRHCHRKGYRFVSTRFFAYALNDTDNLIIVDYSKSGVGVPPYNHQADNLAKLRLEFLPMIELIAKIFGAVSEIKI